LKRTSTHGWERAGSATSTLQNSSSFRGASRLGTYRYIICFFWPLAALQSTPVGTIWGSSRDHISAGGD
jgi:hypothetical protein